MRVIVTTEQRFYQYAKHIYVDGPATYNFWRRYLEVFDEIQITARVAQASKFEKIWQPASGAGVQFLPLPYYLGLREYIWQMRKVKRTIQREVCSSDAYIFRIPGQISYMTESAVRKFNHPYGVEVVGDPYEVFAPGIIKHPLRPFLRRWFTIKTKAICRNASAVTYVTEKTLQRRYPVSDNTFTTHYSSIDLPEKAFALEPRVFPREQQLFALVTMGSLAQRYKGIDTLIASIAKCSQRGLNLNLTIIGDGQYRSDLEALVKKLGLDERVKFLGMIPSGKAVRDQLDLADLFILPSLTEGLPRAMIEAMARALPCIGSTVGGIPELLAADDMIPPGDIDALSQKIEKMLGEPKRMARTSARNLQKAKEFYADTLQQRRLAFYQQLKKTTEAWLQKERMR